MKKSILVLDDSPFMLTVISDMLKQLDYEVTTIDNAKDACQMVESTRYDMIITDLNMPVMDGLEFTKQVKTYPHYKFVPIVMLSSEGNDEKISKAKEMGISTFLSKPPKEAQLKTLLQITLSRRRSTRMKVTLEVFYGKNEMLSGQTVNMSVGGVFVETSSPLSLGEKLKLKLHLPGNNYPVSCQGRVAWVNVPTSPSNIAMPPGMGVEFIGLKDERKLQEFLKSRPLRS
jgi:two-component system chemotaxis response regulator CheY